MAAANIFFNLIDSQNNPLTGSKVSIRPYSPPYLTGSGNNIAGTYGGPCISYTDSVSGSVQFNNIIAGLYKVEYSNVNANNTTTFNPLTNYTNTVFYINVPNSLSGSTVDGFSLIVNQVPSGSSGPFNVISASYAQFAQTTISCSYFSGSISNAITANTASYAVTSSYAYSSSVATTLIPSPIILGGNLTITSSTNQVTIDLNGNPNVGGNNQQIQSTPAGINLGGCAFESGVIFGTTFTGQSYTSITATSSLNSTSSISSSYLSGSATGSLFGTASWSNNSITASWAPVPISASWASQSIWSTSSSFASNTIWSILSSFASQSISASYAQNGPFTTLTTASIYPITSSWSNNSSVSISSSFASQSISASYAITSSYAFSSSISNKSISASYLSSVNSLTASLLFGTASNAVSASYAQSASTALFSNNSNSASFSKMSNTSSYVTDNSGDYISLSNFSGITLNDVSGDEINLYNGEIYLMDANDDIISMNGNLIAIQAGNIKLNGATTNQGYSANLTGSLFGTSSWSKTSVNSLSASYLSGSLIALSSSYAQTASIALFSNNSNNSNYATFANTANNASTASYISGSITNVLTASYANTASFILSSGGVFYSVSSSFASSSIYSVSASWANNSNYSNTSNTSNYATDAGLAITSSYALTGGSNGGGSIYPKTLSIPSGSYSASFTNISPVFPSIPSNITVNVGIPNASALLIFGNVDLSSITTSSFTVYFNTYINSSSYKLSYSPSY